MSTSIQTIKDWYLKNKWTFWSGLFITIVGVVFASFWGSGNSTTAEMHHVNGVVNAQSNIGKQEIYYADRADPNYENQLSKDVSGLEGKALIQKWFDLMTEQNWRAACSLMSKNDCDAGNWESINTAFHFMKERTQNGYENPQIQHAAAAPANVWCVRYHYTMAQTEVNRRIVELMQYKLGRRENGGEEIVTKLCEKQWKEGIGYTDKCAKPPVYYCSNLDW